MGYIQYSYDSQNKTIQLMMMLQNQMYTLFNAYIYIIQ